MYPKRLVHCSKGKILIWLIASLLLASLLGALPSPTTVVFSASDPVEGSRANPVEATTTYPSSFQPASNNPLLSNWSEGFDDITLLPGMGWAFINNSDPLGVSNWFQGNPTVFPAHSGNTNSYIAANFNNTSGVGTISNWLITPELVMNDGDTFTFYTRRADSQWQDRLQVRLSINGASTDVGTTATSVGDFTTLLLDINPTYAPGGYPIVWTQYTITLSGLGGATNGRLAFRYFVENGGPSGSNSDYIGIDTVEYTTSSSPPSPFAYINQPWDWIDGIASPDSNIIGTLRRNGSTIATANTTSDTYGIFSFNFLSGGNHIDLIVGDEVTVNGGGLNTTLTLINISGSINTAANQVSGQASGGVFPSSGIAKVGQPADLGFLAETFDFEADGTFFVDFDGMYDINSNHLAKVQYTDPNGNMVVQLINPSGLDIRVLINEGRIEGVTTPGEEVAIQVSDASGPKASANVAADTTGFYSTLVYDRGYKVDLELGDHIEVKNSSVIRSTTLTMHHVSYLQPWNDRIVGQILGIIFPPEGAAGRIDLWSVDQQKWYTQYIGVSSEGFYGVDFSGIVDMMDGDIVRVWVILPDGNMQAALGWGLHIGVSTSDNEVWGYTTAYESVEISLYQGWDGNEPFDLIGTVITTSQPWGYFSETVMANGQPVDITPSNVIIVKAGGHENTLFIGEVKATAVVDQDVINVSGASNSVVHIEGRRAGVKREDARYQDDYFWREITLDSVGIGSVNLTEFHIQPGDLFDITSYIIDYGLAVHNVTVVPGQPASPIYLPLITRASW